MTLDQLAIFVAVADCQHLTRGAASLSLTPSAASAAIKTLENRYSVRLFDRVGRRIELTRAGMQFLDEARALLRQARSTEQLLRALGGSEAGVLDIQASQTIGNYWLPALLMGFAQEHPGVTTNLQIGNTASVAAAVKSGTAELGFIEGEIDDVSLTTTRIASDHLVIVTAPGADLPGDAGPEALTRMRWVLREHGSGTRAMFEAALAGFGIDPEEIEVACTLPTNEAVLSAVMTGSFATVLSAMVAEPFVLGGALRIVDAPLPPRHFSVLRHRERRLSAPAELFVRRCMAAGPP